MHPNEIHPAGSLPNARYLMHEVARFMPTIAAEPCGLQLVKKFSRSPCLPNVSFGCGNRDVQEVWFTGGCRGAFRLRTKANAPIFSSEDGTSIPADYVEDVEYIHRNMSTWKSVPTHWECFVKRMGHTRHCHYTEAATPGSQPAPSGSPSLAVVFVYATPRHISSALRSWLNTTNFMAVGDTAQPEFNISFVPDQKHTRTETAWGAENNHAGDNRPLAAIRLANRTLDFEWLLVGDADTRYRLSRLQDELRRLLALHGGDRLADYLGFHHPPQWECECEDSMRRCRRELPSSTSWTAPPPAWPYGGAGYMISKALLNDISAAQWDECERRLVNWGGDARVAKCILMHTGTRLTHLPGLGTTLSRHVSATSMRMTPRHCTAKSSERSQLLLRVPTRGF